MSQVNEFNEISFRIMQLSLEAKKQGLEVNADRLIEVAADFELLSDDLQLCWGGPLNGQTGRKAIFTQILEVCSFDAVLETGTYRGITTAWLAEHFSGPIASCELEKIYLRQAQSRLAKFTNVALHLMDSRDFLSQSLSNSSVESKFFIYLDAHWKDDLPLARELEIIDQSGVQAVIAIDDFRVPGDSGYGFDDYGSGKALTIELLASLKDKGYKLYFPRLASNLEDGSKRGVCILSKSMQGELEACHLLRGGDWRDWRIIELEALHQEAMRKVILSDASFSAVVIPPLISASVPESGDGAADWIPVAEHFLKKLDPNVDPETVVQMAPDVAKLLSQHGDFELILEQWVRHADREVEDRQALETAGRALVEERAHSLQLVRQIHQLRECVHELQVSVNESSDCESTEVPTHSLRALDMAVISRVVHELQASRALKLMSLFAPRARLNVDRLEAEIKKIDVK